MEEDAGLLFVLSDLKEEEEEKEEEGEARRAVQERKVVLEDSMEELPTMSVPPDIEMETPPPQPPMEEQSLKKQWVKV